MSNPAPKLNPHRGRGMTLPARLAAVPVHTTRRGATAWVILGCVGGAVSNLSQELAAHCPSARYCPGFGNVIASYDNLRAAAHVLGATLEEPKP